MKKTLLSMLLIFTLLTGCNIFAPVYYEDEEKLVSSSIDSTLYQYSGVVQLDNSYDTHYTDSLELCDDMLINKEEFFDYEHSYEILNGHFSMYCWNDFKIFILMEDTFYVYDIKSYTYPPIDENGNENYELLKYTKEEFQIAYPDFSSYDWTMCETPPKPEVSSKLNLEENLSEPLPYSAKILEYVDTRNDRFSEGYYLKGKVQLYPDDETEKFIYKIKSDWINNISQDTQYEEIDRVAFSKNLIEFSDDYYYFYENTYYDNRATDFYYGDYFNIFAYDEKKMIMYFYISD